MENVVYSGGREGGAAIKIYDHSECLVLTLTLFTQGEVALLPKLPLIG